MNPMLFTQNKEIEEKLTKNKEGKEKIRMVMHCSHWN